MPPILIKDSAIELHRVLTHFAWRELYSVRFCFRHRQSEWRKCSFYEWEDISKLFFVFVKNIKQSNIVKNLKRGFSRNMIFQKDVRRTPQIFFLYKFDVFAASTFTSLTHYSNYEDVNWLIYLITANVGKVYINGLATPRKNLLRLHTENINILDPILDS